MAVLSGTSALYRGTTPVQRVYLGTALIWYPAGEVEEIGVASLLDLLSIGSAGIAAVEPTGIAGMPDSVTAVYAAGTPADAGLMAIDTGERSNSDTNGVLVDAGMLVADTGSTITEKAAAIVCPAPAGAHRADYLTTASASGVAADAPEAITPAGKHIVTDSASANLFGVIVSSVRDEAAVGDGQTGGMHTTAKLTAVLADFVPVPMVTDSTGSNAAAAVGQASPALAGTAGSSMSETETSLTPVVPAFMASGSAATMAASAFSSAGFLYPPQRIAPGRVYFPQIAGHTITGGRMEVE